MSFDIAHDKDLHLAVASHVLFLLQQTSNSTSSSNATLTNPKNVSILTEAAQIIYEAVQAPNSSNSTAAPPTTIAPSDHLAKRWHTLRRLSVKNIELETQVKNLQREVTELRSQVGNEDGDVVPSEGDSSKRSGAAAKKKGVAVLVPESTSIGTLQGHRDTLTAIAFHPSEPLLYSSSEDGTLRVWDTEERQQVQSLRPHTDTILALALAPTNSSHRLLCTGSADCNIRLVDISNPMQAVLGATLRGHEDTVTTLQWQRRGAQEAGGTAPWLWSGSRDGELRQWDTVKNVTVYSLRNPGGWVRALEISTDGLIPHRGSNASVSVTAGDDHSLCVWDLDSKKSTTTHRGGHDHVIQALALSCLETDKYLTGLYGSDEDKKNMRQWEAEELQMLQRRKPTTVVVNGVEISTITAAPGGAEPSDSSSAGGLLTSSSSGAAWTPQYVASGGRDKTIVVRNIHSGNIVLSYHVHENWVRALTFSPSGKHLFSSGDDGNLFVLDLAGSERVVRRIAAHAHFVTCMSLLKNGKLLATGGADGLIKLWTCL